jgi:two-component system cell cycle response regulator CpdR
MNISAYGGTSTMARILLAEDDAEMRSFLAHCLRRAGHDVSATEDGESAASQLERRAFDLLLADVVMPGIDGVELAKRAARIAPDLKIMFITGFAAVALNRDLGPDGRRNPGLSKPFHLNRLVNEVRQMLAA